MTIEPWEVFEGRTDLPSAVGITLSTAFAEVVATRCDYQRHEIFEIATAEDDDGIASMMKDELRLQAEGLAEALVKGQISSFARPVGGGKVMVIPAEHWEIDDPLPRFATGAYNFDDWANGSAHPTHRILVNRQDMDHYLTSFLSKEAFDRQFDVLTDALLMARARLDGQRRVERQASANAAGSTPSQWQLRLMRIEDVASRIGFKRSKIYDMIKTDQFPKQVKLGGRVGWYEHEVEAWIASRPRA